MAAGRVGDGGGVVHLQIHENRLVARAFLNSYNFRFARYIGVAAIAFQKSTYEYKLGLGEYVGR